ncbi:DUF4253 domain-containing protein [Actinoallomurus soli]|uniref:DUF4253 domain-containing protein n=1 Tax=Actinoallomurus soli TaxID=2952535 RepID=UPI002092EE06|nr:DUF4253 domain-containing protein [Actinoallomurus soli]MCO5971745.1 DUF4253 domain-containing protein [Actinoallomurus soli]
MRRESPFEALPEYLPPGRLVTPQRSFARPARPTGPALWVSDEPLPDAGTRWIELFAQHERTGLYPLLLDTLRGDPGRPWHDGELKPPTPAGAIDMLTAEGVLRRFWDSVVPDSEDGAEEEPSGPWPGLAPPGVGGPDADTAAAFAESLGASRHWLLGLVPATRGADSVTLCGWSGPINHTNHTQEISAVLRSWEERFGARVVSVGFDTLQLSVAAPPRTFEHALQVTAEHLAFCPDNIWQGCGDLEMYADGLLDEDSWSFWWD